MCIIMTVSMHALIATHNESYMYIIIMHSMDNYCYYK